MRALTPYLVSAILALSTAARAGDPPTSPTEANVCDVLLEYHGTYYDPKSAITGFSAAGVGVRKIFSYALTAIQQASSKAGSFVESRGLLTAAYTVSLAPAHGTKLPKGTPQPKNFLQADDYQSSVPAAKTMAETYAKNAGCHKIILKHVNAPQVAQSKWPRYPFPLIALFFSAIADAEPELKPDPLSLEEARKYFEQTTQEVSAALNALASDGCITSTRVISLTNAAAQESKNTAAFVTKGLDNLHARIAAPMTLTGNGVCDGSFASTARELEFRRQAISSTRDALSKAIDHQLQVVTALYDVKEYNVRDRNCGSIAFSGFRKGATHGLGSIGNVGQINHALSVDEAEIAGLIKQNQQRLASCGSGAQSPTIATGRAAAQPNALPSAAIGHAPASDITGVKVDQAKQKPDF